MYICKNAVLLTSFQVILTSALPTGECLKLSHSAIATGSDATTSPCHTQHSNFHGPENAFRIWLNSFFHRREDSPVTVSSLPPTQSPTITDGTIGLPATTGSIITTLATEGRPPVQPFPTSLPNVTESTIQPTSITAIPANSLSNAQPLTITGTVTLPLSTLTSVLTIPTIASVAVPTVVSISSVTVVQSTIVSNGSTIVASSVQPTVIETTATVLSATTLAANVTVTSAISTVVSTGNLASIIPTARPTCQFNAGCGARNLFEPVDVSPPASQIPHMAGHPVPRLGIKNTTGPIGTNKFYFNFFLGQQSFPAFVMPYSLTWSKGGGNAQSWGMSISHIDDDQKVYGANNPKIPGSPASYYINPLGIQSVILSAAELGSTTEMTTDSLTDMSANVNLSPTPGSDSKITYPMVQGMAFITAIYTSLQPEVQSSVFFRSVVAVGQVKSGVYKYRITLEDSKTWLLYAVPSYGVDPNLQLKTSTMLQGITGWSGFIQVAKLPLGASESIFDEASGVYAVSGAVSGYGTYDSAQYSLSWSKSGPYAGSTSVLIYALPHHLQSFDPTTQQNVMGNIVLQTPAKGQATAVLGDYWILNESLHPSMGFEPWRPDTVTMKNLPANIIAQIRNISTIEASQNMTAQSDLNSMYYSGKALSKFATIVYTMNDLLDQRELAATALNKLKDAFATFASNKQVFPLYYDTDWKGIVSSASYVTGDAGVDFGNSYYNDHHFHYGYFIHAAAIIGYLDSEWAQANKDYVNTLVRDVANPSSLDQYFPVSRSFDYYAGHSWAKGLFETGDGKDEESTSEDAMFAYALKMWGRTIGDESMERRGDLMLSIVSRAIQTYFLMDSDNKVQPARFIGNKATGILFENKCDHVTYFGANIEYIQGIQMVPALPFSTLTRTKKFVTEEWETFFANGATAAAQNVLGGWKGILFGNLAIINPQAAYNFFSQDNFDPSWIDGGASLTWYLTYTALLGGAS